MTGLLTLLLFGLVLLIVLLTLMLVREMQRPPRHTAAYALARNWPVDPGELALSFQDWILDRPDGAMLPVWEILSGRPSEDDGPKRPVTVVFVHGWGHSRIDSLHRVEPFLPLCDRIVMYDLRGHGDSTGSLSRLGDGEEEDLLALLERLGSDDLYILVGHSMGAVIAISAAIASRRAGMASASKIAGIVAYGPYCEFHQSLRGRLKVARYPGRPITDLALLALGAMGIRPRSLRESDFGDLACPLLVFHGCNDPVSPIEHARRIVAGVPNGKLCEISDAAHTDAHTCNPLEHQAIVGEFITSVAGNTHSEKKSPGVEATGPPVMLG